MTQEKKNSRKSIIFIGTGLLLLAAALFLTAYNIWDGVRADRSAQEVNGKIQTMILEYASSEDAVGEEAVPEESMPEEQKMAAMEIDGNLYIGVLEVPALNISLPVMAECDYNKLKIAPCWYSGSYYTDDLVIAGHNYPKHFSPLKWVEPGSEVLFTTADGEVYRYTVDWLENVRPGEVDKMVEKDGWDLTLFTCTTGGSARCAVRCVRERN